MRSDLTKCSKLSTLLSRLIILNGRKKRGRGGGGKKRTKR